MRVSGHLHYQRHVDPPMCCWVYTTEISWGGISGQHCKCLATGVYYTKTATFIPLPKHLSFLAKIWTLLSSNKCPLSFGCSWMAKSWPEELALRLYSGCLVSPMYRSIDSSVHWTTWPTLIYVSVFFPSGLQSLSVLPGLKWTCTLCLLKILLSISDVPVMLCCLCFISLVCVCCSLWI